MRIRGAVLTESALARPYAQSGPLSISDLDLDPPGDGELLIRLEAAGVCHSDLSVVNGSRVRPLPMLLGHEGAGIVEGIGSGVDDIQLGERVVLVFLPRCGACDACRTEGRLPCTPGSAANGNGTLMSGARRMHRDGEPVQHHLGVSAFATHAVVDRRSVVPVPPDVPPTVAALLGCAVLTGGGAVMNAGRLAPGEDVIVVGLGGVGMAAVLTAIAQSAGRVTAVDAVDSKLERALQLGASAAYSPTEAAALGVRAPLVIEAAGNARAFETAVELTAVGGRTVTVGLPAPEARSSISPLVLTAEARTIIGSYLGSAVPSRDIPIFVDLWRRGRLPVEKLISSSITLDALNEAMDGLADGSELRQLITFPGSL
ncbi:alcohol dehydrogenase [Microbacterium sp. W4I4]|uniref:alcohol dehydrogenase catalytic domain-containing protein n=1 Tax=Microbacterium sp. W4I4 TaxID=3042295 RepID=UPI002781D107|nr:alcohol dehydrogenase catalytic domain-containing protein [Microbacterium sp. W4I4]MDQ0613997.1 alcohol dehydrogenase [Microbacterium sp. W4I4]